MHSRRRLLLGGAASVVVTAAARAQCIIDPTATNIPSCRRFSGTLGSSVSAPSLDINLLGPSLDGRITFTRAAGAATYFDATGTQQTAAANVPRFDADPLTFASRGLLIEEARTNNIRNSTGTGAVGGSPGTDPTGWSSTQALGLTRTIALGTEQGVPYVQYRFNAAGATAGNLNITLAATGTSGLPVTGSTAYAFWTYISFSAGSFPGGTGMTLRLNQYDSGGVSAGALASGVFSYAAMAIGDPLVKTRLVYLPTIAATAAFVQPFIQIPITAGAVDFTIRVGGLQLEAGAFATSFIPTTNATVTRNLDLATMPTAAWFNAAAFSTVTDAMLPVNVANFCTLISLNDGTTNNRLQHAATSLSPRSTVSSGGTNSVANPETATVSVGVPFRFGGAIAAGSYLSALNGGAPYQTAAGIVVPASVSTLSLGNIPPSPTIALNGYLRRVRAWPNALTTAQLQTATQ